MTPIENIVIILLILLILYVLLDSKPKRKRLTQDQLAEVFARQGNKCAWCGSRTNLTIDHIRPVIAYGQNNYSNLRVLCRKCNSKKGKKW